MKKIILFFLFSLSISPIFADEPTKRLSEILKSGDGNSPKTAYEVYSVSEEYELLKYLKLKYKKQLLVLIEGQNYDVIKIEDGQKYFKIIKEKQEVLL